MRVDFGEDDATSDSGAGDCGEWSASLLVWRGICAGTGDEALDRLALRRDGARYDERGGDTQRWAD